MIVQPVAGFTVATVQLREAIENAGGLVSKSGIGRKLNVTPQRASQLAAHATFPRPVAELDNGSPVWAWNDVREWHERRSELRR